MSIQASFRMDRRRKQESRMTARTILRQAAMALAIAAFAPVGLAVFDLESPALAAGKGAGNANDRSDNKSDNANKGNKGNSANKSNSGANQSLDTDTELNKGQAKKAEMMAAGDHLDGSRQAAVERGAECPTNA
jgi:hypothetical protein